MWVHLGWIIFLLAWLSVNLLLVYWLYGYLKGRLTLHLESLLESSKVEMSVSNGSKITNTILSTERRTSKRLWTLLPFVGKNAGQIDIKSFGKRDAENGKSTDKPV